MNKLVLAAVIASFTATAAVAQDSPNLEIQSQRMLEMQQRAGADQTPSRSFSATARIEAPTDSRIGSADATGIGNPIGQSSDAIELRRLMHGS